MEKQKKVRRNYLINARFQLKVVAILIIFMLAVALISSLTIYHSVWTLLGEKLANVYPQGRLAGILRTSNLVLVSRMLMVIPVVVVFSIVLSHRIAGPMFHINKVLDRLVKGDYSLRVHLRRTDELQDIANRVNAIAEILENNVKKPPKDNTVAEIKIIGSNEDGSTYMEKQDVLKKDEIPAHKLGEISAEKESFKLKAVPGSDQSKRQSVGGHGATRRKTSDAGHKTSPRPQASKAYHNGHAKKTSAKSKKK